MMVEREKLASHFPGFSFYSQGDRVSSVQGRLRTSYGNYYYVRVGVPPNYPYAMPEIELPQDTIDPSCPHQFTGGRICVMRSAQWSSTLSLAFMVAKVAVWLNKYDSWKRNGRRAWPGKGQEH